MASCSHCWRAPIYFTASLLLAFIAISTGLHSRRTTASSPSSEPVIPLQILLKASKSLQKAGFTAFATLLPVSPEYFFSFPNTTIFAIPDSSVAKLSLSPWLLRDVVQYHTVPTKLTMDDLLKRPEDSCLPTLLHQRSLVITKRDNELMQVQINHVVVTHPDVFLGDNLTIHGVFAPFISPGLEEKTWALNLPQSSECESTAHALVSDVHESNDPSQWGSVIRSLSSNGFISFAIGLNSVLDGILEDDADMKSVTIFAPIEFQFLSSPREMLDRIIRAHILPRKYSPKELAELPKGKLLMTLVPHRFLKICGKNSSVAEASGVKINGAEIELPLLFESTKIVIYKISRPFEMTETENF